MKVGLASADWSQSIEEHDEPAWGGSGWARLGQYVPLLPFDIVYGTLISDRGLFGVRTWDAAHHLDCDVIIMQRWMHEMVAEGIPLARASGQVIINDVDDWWWGLSEKNQAHYWSHPTTFADENIEHYRKILALSDAVFTSTPWLRDNLSNLVPLTPVELIENSIDFSRFSWRDQQTPPTIGWAGSTEHRSGDLELLRGIVPSLANEGLRFRHVGHRVGHRTFASVVGLSDHQVIADPMVSPGEYGHSLNFDIGLVPLTDIPFNYAKSCIKGLEYAAAGIPFVASDVGEYRRLRVEYGVGRTVHKYNMWRRHIEALSDPAIREQEAVNNRINLQTWSIEYRAKTLADAIATYAR